MMAGAQHKYWLCWQWMAGWSVSEKMLFSILSVCLQPLDKLCGERALGPLCGDLLLQDFLMPFLLMCDLRS